MITIAAGMFSGNPEWSIVLGCSFGGIFGSAIGLFLAVLGPQDKFVWRICALRWSVNFASSTVFAPILYWWIDSKGYYKTDGPSPILAMACGGVVGMLFIMLLQLVLPMIKRRIEKKAEEQINRIIP